MSKNFTVKFSRIEINWLYRQLMAGHDRAVGLIKTYDDIMAKDYEQRPPAIPEDYNRFRCLSEEQIAEYETAVKHRDELKLLTTAIADRMFQGDKERLGIVNLKTDLEEALTLAEEESAKEEARKRLAALPAEESYNISFDRATCKFTLKLIENDLQKFRAHVIPAYEQAEASTFKDPVQTKSYWVNKARQSKTILENLKEKLEKNL